MRLAVGYEPADAACVGASGGGVLARIDHGRSHGRYADAPWRLSVGLNPLSAPDLPESSGAPWCEVWRVADATRCGWEAGVGFAEGGGWLLAHLLADDDGSDLSRLTEDLYTRLLRLLGARGYPHLVRMWSYLPDIHRRVGGLERYRGFCVGRDRAFRGCGLLESRFPAATAIGSAAPGLLVYCLAGRRPGEPVENPRQISAYRYPPCYGPRPPSFARGLKLPATGPGPTRLLVSGTAAVVGHRSCHRGDLGAQLEETLANLDALARAAGMDGRWQDGDTPPLLKVFLRDPAGLGTVAARLGAWSRGRARVLYLHGEVCREELAIEIEGVL